LSDVGCFPNCCSAFLWLLMASLQFFSCTPVRTGTSQLCQYHPEIQKFK
jgi:hypothetical protein